MATNLTRFDPFNPFSDLGRLDPFRDFDDLFRTLSSNPMLRDNEASSRVRIDVTETENAYFVKADVPGMQKEDVKVAIEGNQVSISAEGKRDMGQQQGETTLRTERPTGRQMRTFVLPQEVDDTQAEAKYVDGVLELVLPKKQGGAGGKQLVIH